MSILLLLKVACLGIFGLVLVAAILLFLGILIPKNKTFNKQSEGVTIYLSGNGFHTDFVLPIQHASFDWQPFVDLDKYDFLNKETGYLAIGWGDRAIYLDLADWSELTLKMAVKPMFWPTPTAMHVTAYDNLPEDDAPIKRFQAITISTNQYLQLCCYILGFFEVNAQQRIQLIEGRGYTEKDNFYEAVGKYHLFNTCNTWVSRGLARIGVRAPFWTPLDRGIFYQLRKITDLPVMAPSALTTNYD
ncbi:MAG: TIGR02117 family protein [Bacteroidota bacterium]